MICQEHFTYFWYNFFQVGKYFFSSFYFVIPSRLVDSADENRNAKIKDCFERLISRFFLACKFQLMKNKNWKKRRQYRSFWTFYLSIISWLLVSADESEIKIINAKRCIRVKKWAITFCLFRWQCYKKTNRGPWRKRRLKEVEKQR